MHKKSFNVDVSDAVSDEFSAQVDERGYTKYRAVEGALRVFMALPADIQVKLMSNGIEDIVNLLTEALLDAEIMRFLGSLPPQQRQTLLQDVKQARVKVSRKK